MADINNTGTAPVNNAGTGTSPSLTANATGAESTAFKTFTTQKDFDDYSAGILHTAQVRAEKDLLKTYGLEGDDAKSTLAKYKQAYDNSISDAEKNANAIQSLKTENAALRNQVEEANAVVKALMKLSGGDTNISQIVKMAKGLVTDEITLDNAIDTVMKMVNIGKPAGASSIPSAKPLQTSSVTTGENNPFKTNNLTAQGQLIMADRDKARQAYRIAYGKDPSW